MKLLGFSLFSCVILANAMSASAQQSAPRVLDSRWRGDDVSIQDISPEKVNYIAQLHCNSLRLHIDVDPANHNKPLDQQVAPTEKDPLAPYAANLKLLDDVLPICRKDGIQVVIAGGDIYGRKTDVFEKGTIEGSNIRVQLREFWTAMSARYKDEPAIVAYDIRNEPTYAESDKDSWWKQMLPECIAAIRKNDSTVWIVVEPYMAFADHFPEVPIIDDPKVIYSFHTYWPHGYTHQGVRFRQHRSQEDSLGAWTYPGNAPRVENPKQPIAAQKLSYWDKAAVLKTMQPVIDFQKAHPGVRILCGEFGVIRWAPNNAVYLKDMIDLLEQQGWDWTFHSLGEWNGWDPSYASTDPNVGNRKDFTGGVVETDRLQVLKAGWALNVPPQKSTAANN